MCITIYIYVSIYTRPLVAWRFLCTNDSQQECEIAEMCQYLAEAITLSRITCIIRCFILHNIATMTNSHTKCITCMASGVWYHACVAHGRCHSPCVVLRFCSKSHGQHLSMWHYSNSVNVANVRVIRRAISPLWLHSITMGDSNSIPSTAVSTCSLSLRIRNRKSVAMRGRSSILIACPHKGLEKTLGKGDAR